MTVHLTALRNIAIATALAVSLMACSAPLARASVIEGWDLPKALDQATIVVFARCLSVEVKYDPEQNNKIRTFYTFKKLHVAKGAMAPNEFTLRFPGGSLDGKTTVVFPTPPTFDASDEAVLLIWQSTPAAPYVLDDQELFRVKEDDQNGRRYIEPRPDGIQIFDTETGEPFSKVPTRVYLDDFLYTIEQMFPE